MTRSIIVGLDPGTTIGIAIIGTKGDVLGLLSKRYARRGEIVKYISDFGNPIIVASDVNPAPKLIERIARLFGSKIFCPDVSLSNVEKAKIVKEFENDVKSFHQKDALAAGIKAFKNYRELFIKIDDAASKLGVEDEFDEIVRRVLLGKTKNIADVVRSINPQRK